MKAGLKPAVRGWTTLFQSKIRNQQSSIVNQTKGDTGCQTSQLAVEQGLKSRRSGGLKVGEEESFAHCSDFRPGAGLALRPAEAGTTYGNGGLGGFVGVSLAGSAVAGSRARPGSWLNRER